MAAPVNANINIIANTEQAMGQFRALQAQVAATNKSISATSGAAAAQQAALSKGLLDSANASRMWQARIVPMNTAVQQFSTALDKGRLSLGQYTRYAASQLPGMSRVFKREFDMMNRAATRNVRQMQTQYLELGRSATGAAQAMALTPTALNKHASAAAIAAQRQMMFNRMIDLGTTKLLNYGKNTQWAGRQLMVGFSIPLAMVGAVAAKTFKEIDQGSIAFKRVYGDLSTTTAEMERNLQAVKDLGAEYTRYGLKLSDTIELAADVAATGAKNNDLLAATEQTLRLSTLGLMEYDEALEATIALQTAFSVNSEDLGTTIDFLNVVENETILTMQDMAAAIPRVAPVIKGLGGDVRDLAVLMTAMREGGVTAAEGANALKTGLGRLINPTKAARDTLEGFGLNLTAMIQSNRGDLMGMINDFGAALATLDDFEQQQALEKVFGKRQYARLGALFKNIANDASQAQRTVELTNMSVEDLGTIADRELGKIEEATSTKFAKAVEQLKVAIAPIGEQFMKALTPVINFITKLADSFNNLPENIKNAISIGIAAIAGVGPIVLMTIGLIANGIANIGKLIQTMRKFFARLRGDSQLFNYLTQEEREATTAANALSGATDQLTGKFLGQKRALDSLITTVGRYSAALASSVGAAPMAFGVGAAPAAAAASGRSIVTGPQSRTTVTRGYADGVVKVPGTGNKDTIPAMLTPGESVITKEATKKYAPMIQAMNDGKIPGFEGGVTNLRGTYLTGAGKLINPVAMMQPGAGGNQSSAGVNRSQFPTATGQALFAGMGKSAMDLATRMQTLSRFSMSALKAFDPLDDLFNRIHGEVSSQLKNSATIDEAIQKAKPEVKKITSEYIKQKVLSGQMTKVEARRVRVATRLLMNEQSTVKRMGLIRAERLDVRGDKVIPRTQTEGKGAPLSTYRNLPRVAERELARRGLATPRGFSQYERSHMQSVGKQPFIPGMVSPRVQGKGLTPQAKQAIERIARQEAQTHTRAYEQATKDPALIARDRNSPHPIVTKDAQSDARQYANTIKQTLMGLTPIKTGKPLVAASTPNLPQGTQFRAPGGGVAQVYNPSYNPRGLGVTGEARAVKGAIAAIESRTGVLNRLRAEEEAQIAESKKIKITDRRRTGAVERSAVLLEEENSFLTRSNQAAQRLAQQRALNEAALKAEQEAQARLNGAKQRAAVMQETMNQRPARGGMLDRPLGALRRFAFPGGQDAALKNLGFNQFSGQMKSAGKLIAESAQNIKTRVVGTLRTLPQDFKIATQQLTQESKMAGIKLKADFKSLGSTIKTNMLVDLDNVKRATTTAANAVRRLGTSAASAAQRMAGGVGAFMTSVDKNGVSRMQKMGQASSGAVMGLMGLSMAASFAGGGVGEMAQKIMPVTMGLMGLQMILPMLTNPIGLAIIAIAALTAGAIFSKKRLDDLAKSASEAGANIGGMADSLGIIEEATGFSAPDPQDRLFRFTKEDREAMSEFGSYFESESGSKFIKDLREATSEERYEKVSYLLAQGIASGLEKEKAEAFGKAIAEATGDSLLNSRIARDFANDIFGYGADRLVELEKERSEKAPKISPFGKNLEVGETGLFGGKPGERAPILEGFMSLFGKSATIKNIEQAYTVLGFTSQQLANLTQAEALLQDQRSKGEITLDEYKKQESEIEKIRNQATSTMSDVFQILGPLAPNIKAAFETQLKAAGFDNAGITKLMNEIAPEDLSQKIFGEAYLDLSENQSKYIDEVFAATISGITPENMNQKIMDIESIYKEISEDFVNGAFDGLSDAAQMLGFARGIEQSFDVPMIPTGGAGESQQPSAKELAENLQSANDELMKFNTDSKEVFTTLSGFKDIKFAAGLLEDEESILRVGEAIGKLGEYEDISIEFVLEGDIDPDSVIRAIESVKSIELDPDLFGNAGYDADFLVQKMMDLGYSAGQVPAALRQGVIDAKHELLQLEQSGINAFNKLSNIKIKPKIIMSLLDMGDVESATAVSNQLSSVFPDELPTSVLPIMIQLLGTEQLAAIAGMAPGMLDALMKNPALQEYNVSSPYGGVTYTPTQQDRETAKIMGLIQDLASGSPERKKGEDDGGGGGGGGGAAKEQSALEKLQESIAKRTALYLGLTKAGKKLDDAKKGYFGRLLAETTTNNSIANQLRKMNLSETLIADILAEGAENAEEIINALGPNGLKRLSKQDILSRAGELVDQKKGEAKRGEYKATAKRRLEETGKFTAEEIEEILQDEGATEIIALLPKKAKKVWNQLIKALLGAADATEEVETASERALRNFDEQSSRFDKLVDMMNQGFDAAEMEAADAVAAKFFEDNTGLAEKLAESTGHTVENGYQLSEAMERQMLLNDRLIDQEQERIDGKQEEIDDYNRINDLIKQGIDDLKRQEELRSRRSESLSRDLDEISRLEDQVRESYEKRIDALDKVAEVNDYIIEQQKKQIDLSKAISEGDIYAATQAAQDMRAASAQQAVEQRRSALEQGMENAIAGLTNAEGMTRAEIEDEINNIKEQNYQTSLLIRKEEDRIYQNNLEVRRLSNEIYDIQENIIEPLQNQNKEYSKMLEYYKEDADYQVSRVTLAGMTREQFERQAEALQLSIDNARDLDPELKKLVGDYEAIERAARAAADQAARLGTDIATEEYTTANPNAATTSGYTPIDYTNMDPGLFAGMDFSGMDFSAIFSYAGGLIKKYAAGGLASPLKYTSNEPPPAQKRGMGGKIKYAIGGVAGDGSRDSVHAMLTPGEFVIRKAMVDKYGIPMMKALNQGSFAMPRYDTGQEFEPNVTATNNTSVSNISAPVYNTYDMKFAISGANQSADEIANQVMFKMRQLQSQGIRSNRGY